MIQKPRRRFLSGQFGVFVILVLIFIGAFTLVGGFLPTKDSESKDLQIGSLEGFEEGGVNPALQLRTLKFGGASSAEPPPASCTETVALDFLLDLSSSMADYTPTGEKKVERLKESVISITSELNDNTVLGIQSFRGYSSFCKQGTPCGDLVFSETIPVSYYKDVKDTIEDKIKALNVRGNTPTYLALKFSFEKLLEALPNFPDRKFHFIFISDGQPVPSHGSSNSQDPRDHNPNPADQIKDMGIEVYTLAVYNSDQEKNSKNSPLTKLMISIASKPENFFQSGTADDLEETLRAIAEKVCS